MKYTQNRKHTNTHQWKSVFVKEDSHDFARGSKDRGARVGWLREWDLQRLMTPNCLFRVCLPCVCVGPLQWRHYADDGSVSDGWARSAVRGYFHSDLHWLSHRNILQHSERCCRISVGVTKSQLLPRPPTEWHINLVLSQTRARTCPPTHTHTHKLFLPTACKLRQDANIEGLGAGFCLHTHLHTYKLTWVSKYTHRGTIKQASCTFNTDTFSIFSLVKLQSIFGMLDLCLTSH